MRTNKTDYVRLTLNLEPEYLDNLRALARAEGLPVGIFVRRHLHDLVDRAAKASRAFSMPAVRVENTQNAHNNQAEVA